MITAGFQSPIEPMETTAVAGEVLRLLLIEDDDDDAELIVRELRRAGFRVQPTRVCQPAELRRALQNETWDIVTSDHHMPAFSAPEALAIVRDLLPEVPVVVVSGQVDLGTAVQLMKQGADDYVQKDKLACLAASVDAALQQSKRKRERSPNLKCVLTPLAEAAHMSVAWDDMVCQQRLFQHISLNCPVLPIGPAGPTWEKVHPDDQVALAHAYTGFVASSLPTEVHVTIRVRTQPDEWQEVDLHLAATQTGSDGRPLDTFQTVQSHKHRPGTM